MRAVLVSAVLLVAGTLLGSPAGVVAGRGRLRSLNELLIESQSARHLPSMVGNLQRATPQRQFAEILAPKKKQTREKKLRRVLGRDYDETWMSLTEPEVKVTQQPSKKADLELLSEITKVNTSLVLGDNKGVADLNPAVGKVIEKWLLQRAACPVTFIWDDLGDLFWPRWVKRGVCGTGKRDLDRKYGPGFVPREPEVDKNKESSEKETERSCSWPAGMHCVPFESHTLRVLRWHCYPRSHRERGNQRQADRKRKHRRTRIKCTWIKVPYPVTSGCYCSC